MKLEPIFIDLDDALLIHQYQVDNYGGASGVRDAGLLDSALGMPRQAFGGSYMHEDLAAMAAAYLFHIVQNHPFTDGNKRTGMHTAIIFLDLNGVPLEIPTDEAEALTLSVATGKATKETVSGFFRKLMEPAAE